MGYYTAYNENGELQDYSTEEKVSQCKYCGKKYRQVTEEQVPGFRDISDDICPYCNKSNGRSGDVEFFNSKMEE